MYREKFDHGISYAHVRALKNSGKKSGSGKSGSENPALFDQIFVNVHCIRLFYEIKPRYFEILTKVSLFQIEISLTNCLNFIENPSDIYFS